MKKILICMSLLMSAHTVCYPSGYNRTAIHGALSDSKFTSRVCTADLLSKTKGAIGPICLGAVILEAVVTGGKLLGALGKSLHTAYKKSGGVSTKIEGVPFREKGSRAFNFLKCQMTCTHSLGLEAAPLLKEFVKEHGISGDSLFYEISVSQNARYQPLQKAVSCLTDCQLKPTLNFTCNFLANATDSLESNVQLASELATTRSMSLKSNNDINASKLSEYVGKGLYKRCEATSIGIDSIKKLKNNLEVFQNVKDQLGSLIAGKASVQDLIAMIEQHEESIAVSPR